MIPPVSMLFSRIDNASFKLPISRYEYARPILLIVLNVSGRFPPKLHFFRSRLCPRESKHYFNELSYSAVPMSKSKFRSSWLPFLPFSTSKIRLLLAIMKCQFQAHIIPIPVRSCKAFNLVSFLHFRRMGILSSILHCISSSSEAIPPFVLHKTCFTQQRILESNCSIFFFKTTKPKK